LTEKYGKSNNGSSIVVRLPTEVEWEYACRAQPKNDGSYSRFGGGNEPDIRFVNVKALIPPNTSEIDKQILRKLESSPSSDDKFDSNRFGLVAMNGNVWEMVSDRWHGSYADRPSGTQAWDPITDPNLIGRGEDYYVIRGGSFNTPAYMAQCSYRSKGTIGSSGNGQVGFRIVIDGLPPG
jgi:formylglycine-generating enzyme required for sulfatase activity